MVAFAIHLALRGHGLAWAMAQDVDIGRLSVSGIPGVSDSVWESPRTGEEDIARTIAQALEVLAARARD